MSKNNNMKNTNYQDGPTITPEILKLRRENGRSKILIERHYPDAKIIHLKSGGAYIELAKHVETMPMPAYEAAELFTRLSTKLKLRPND